VWTAGVSGGSASRRAFEREEAENVKPLMTGTPGVSRAVEKPVRKFSTPGAKGGSGDETASSVKGRYFTLFTPAGRPLNQWRIIAPRRASSATESGWDPNSGQETGRKQFLFRETGNGAVVTNKHLASGCGSRCSRGGASTPCVLSRRHLVEQCLSGNGTKMMPQPNATVRTAAHERPIGKAPQHSPLRRQESAFEAMPSELDFLGGRLGVEEKIPDPQA